VLIYCHRDVPSATKPLWKYYKITSTNLDTFIRAFDVRFDLASQEITCLLSIEGHRKLARWTAPSDDDKKKKKTEIDEFKYIKERNAL
jgi:hypothetical protein